MCLSEIMEKCSVVFGASCASGGEGFAFRTLKNPCLGSTTKARDPGGGPESRLWAAVAGRGQDVRTARPDVEYWRAASVGGTRRHHAHGN
jgi:hypothetical protein